MRRSPSDDEKPRRHLADTEREEADPVLGVTDQRRSAALPFPRVGADVRDPEVVLPHRPVFRARQEDVVAIFRRDTLHAVGVASKTFEQRSAWGGGGGAGGGVRVLGPGEGPFADEFGGSGAGEVEDAGVVSGAGEEAA